MTEKEKTKKAKEQKDFYVDTEAIKNLLEKEGISEENKIELLDALHPLRESTRKKILKALELSPDKEELLWEDTSNKGEKVSTKGKIEGTEGRTDYFDKYIDKRFENIENTMAQILQSNKDLKEDLKSEYKDLKSSNRQLLAGIIVLVFTAGAGFVGIIIALISIMKLLVPGTETVPTP